jgi:CheY-like chemotaxis protein
MPDNGKHIMVVDDLVDAVDSLAALVNLWGYRGEAQYGGAAALKSVGLRRPSVVLLDLDMPRTCGFEFTRCVREMRGGERIPIVAITGYTSEAYQARARELGIGYYLYKPANLARLRALLGQLAPLEVMMPSPILSPAAANRFSPLKSPFAKLAKSTVPGNSIHHQEAAACWS